MVDEFDLCQQVEALLQADSAISLITSINESDCQSISHLFGALLANAANGNLQLKTLCREVFAHHPDLRKIALRDISETARRNFEPAGSAASLLFSRGIHATLAHRVAHQLWQENTTLALAVKSTLSQSLCTDIHPAAMIGSGFWLDHGLGFVMGETAIIEDDVSIWHNVTLGSTLTDSGPTRHPTIRRGAVIGAGAQILGNIEIGEGAMVAAGAIVLNDIAARKVAVGVKAKVVGESQVSFIDSHQDCEQ